MGAVSKGRGLQGLFQAKLYFAQYFQPVPFPSSLQTSCSHRPLQLLKFNHIKTLTFWALMCRRFAKLAADGPTRNSSIPVWLQEEAERERGTHSPPTPHQVAQGRAGQQGHHWCSPFLPCLSCHHQTLQSLWRCQKKGQEERGQRISPLRQKGNISGWQQL